MSEWSDVEKAEWILKNGHVQTKQIFERVDNKVYARPVMENGAKLPPWISAERKLISTWDKGNDEER
jgi:hypothetical protein